MKKMVAFFVSLLIGLSVRAIEFDPGTAHSGKMTRMPSPSWERLLPVDPILLERANRIGEKGRTPVAQWVVENAFGGDTMRPQELNTVGRNLLNSVFDAPDRMNYIWRNENDVLCQIESVRLGAGVRFKGGQFSGFTADLLNANGDVVGKSPLRTMIQYETHPTGSARTKETLNSQTILTKTILETPDRMNRFFEDATGTTWFQIESREMGMGMISKITPTSAKAGWTNGWEAAARVPDSVIFEEYLRLNHRDEWTRFDGSPLLHTPAGRLEFKGHYRKANISTLEGFESQAPALIKAQGLTMDEFHRWVTEPVDSIPPKISVKIKAVRDAVPFPTRETLLEKTIPDEEIQKYFDGRDTDIRGHITRAQDTKGLMNYRDRYNTLRLDYQGSRFNDAGDSSLGVIRFKTGDVEKVQIPYGPVLGGKETEGYPFTGNGFVSAGNGAIVPEFKISNTSERVFLDIPEGAEIYRVTQNGEEILEGIYDMEFNRFIRMRQ